MTVTPKNTTIAVAPMMDWTDRHCRYFMRQFSPSALLYTEMVTAPALVRGGALHLLDFDPAEQPVAVQLGGYDPGELAPGPYEITVRATDTSGQFTEAVLDFTVNNPPIAHAGNHPTGIRNQPCVRRCSSSLPC